MPNSNPDGQTEPAVPGQTNDATAPAKSSSPAAIAIAWIVVGIPLLWGVTQTARTSIKLFQAPAAASAPQH